MSELILSASSVSCFQDCHYQWMLKYVERHTGEQNVPAAIGLAVHAAIERWYKDQMDVAFAAPVGEAVLAEMRRHALTAFDDRFLFETMDMADPDEDLGKAREVGRRVLVAYLEDVAPHIVPVWVEKRIQINVNGIEYSMFIDLLDDQDIIHDHKILKSKLHRPADKLAQLVGNALGFRAETGRIERDVMLDVMIRLKRDRPYHVPYRYGGPVSDLDIGKFAASLEAVAEGIAAHDYEPTGLLNGACRYCAVKLQCTYYEHEVAAGRFP